MKKREIILNIVKMKYWSLILLFLIVSCGNDEMKTRNLDLVIDKKIVEQGPNGKSYYFRGSDTLIEVGLYEYEIYALHDTLKLEVATSGFWRGKVFVREFNKPSNK